VSSSTFSGNYSNYGGGISNDGGMLSVSNSTFYGNGSILGEAGGGIYNNGGMLSLMNSTFFGNSAGVFGKGGSIYNEDSGTVTLNNTIAGSPTGSNCFGTLIDGGGNLSYPDTTCPGINADPVLGPLQNNGGPTDTMALNAGSDAVDGGTDAICGAPPVNGLDQRGISRPQGPHCDIGAFEALAPQAYLPTVMK
jgi:hypothetical protein